jgi:hypothetical protein
MMMAKLSLGGHRRGRGRSFTRQQIQEWAKTRTDMRPMAAVRTFTVLEAGADQLGLAVVCPLTRCAGRLCRAPHVITADSFLAIQPRAILGIKGGGPHLAWIAAEWQKHLAGGG